MLHGLFSVMASGKEHPNERESLCSCRGNLVGILALRGFAVTFLEATHGVGHTPGRAVGLVSQVFRHLYGKRGRSGIWICQRGTRRRGLLLAL
jgi:hypothetical protein